MEFSCGWAVNHPLMKAYHDKEWGVPLHDDHKLFEFLVLEGFQAGLSWLIVLRKREAFRKAFAGFDPVKVAGFTSSDVERLLTDRGIIRNRSKIEAVIHNARCFLKVVEEWGSFDHYIWSFAGHKPLVNHFRELSELPARTDLSDAISAEMKRRGFKYAGSTIMYAHMQATGMVNDHLVHCSRHSEIIAMVAGQTLPGS